MPEGTTTENRDQQGGRGSGVTVLSHGQKGKEIPKTGQGDEIRGIVEFGLGGNHYAMDIAIAREILEMMPITPIPHAPPYMRGVMNLRGEITHIIDLHTILGLDDRRESLPAKIIVLTPEAAGGESIGIIVEEVMGVGNVGSEEIRSLEESAYSRNEGIIKGIIRHGTSTGDDAKGEHHLLVWLDLQSLIQDLIRQAGR